MDMRVIILFFEDMDIVMVVIVKEFINIADSFWWKIINIVK